MAPATNPASPATRMFLLVPLAAATPMIRLAVDTMPSLAPRTAARSQPIRSVRCRSRCFIFCLWAETDYNLLIVFRRNVPTAPAKRCRHPDELIDKAIDAALVSFVEQLATIVELTGHGGKIQIRKGHRKTELADHRNTGLDHTRP